MDTDSQEHSAILERAKQSRARFIQLQFADLHGSNKSTTIPFKALPDALRHGVWFDGSSVEGFGRISQSDMVLKLDGSTYGLLPWEDGDTNTARVICDIYTPSGDPFESDPRFILKKALSEAAELGFRYNVGPELEFFLFRKSDSGELVPRAHDSASYFDFAPRDAADEVRKHITLALESLDIEVEMSHHEVAPGQHEIDFRYGDALIQADRCMTFKQVVKNITVRDGLYASFMPKPIFGINGSGMHVHQSLVDIETGRNLFYGSSDNSDLSDLAKHFIAGQLAHAKAISAITAPIVNSYKRLVPGYEAPVYICWARRNRSALIRIPSFSAGREDAARCELRCPDPSCNPYLAFAVMLKAGLDGVRRKLLPPEPLEEDVYRLTDAQRRDYRIDTLPGSLNDAITALEADTVIRDALGDRLTSVYVKTKRLEWLEYSTQVTQWELKKYFERL